jgi:hypothetical protein
LRQRDPEQIGSPEIVEWCVVVDAKINALKDRDMNEMKWNEMKKQRSFAVS